MDSGRWARYGGACTLVLLFGWFAAYLISSHFGFPYWSTLPVTIGALGILTTFLFQASNDTTPEVALGSDQLVALLRSQVEELSDEQREVLLDELEAQAPSGDETSSPMPLSLEEWSVELSPRVREEIELLDEATREKIRSRLSEIEDTPGIGGRLGTRAEKVAGHDLRKIRIGPEYRALADVDHEQNTIRVVAIADKATMDGSLLQKTARSRRS